MTKKFSFLLFVLAVIAFSSGCSAGLPVYNQQEGETDLYISPQPVTISGYNGSAMEPFIALDGKFLFFNTDDDPQSKAKTLHFAERTGPLSFRYLGEVPGVNLNVPKLVDAAVPSLDAQGHFYFISTRQFDKDSHSVFVGDFDGRAVTNIHAVEGDINPHDEGGVINMDVGISPDGQTMFISKARFGLFGGIPHEASLLVSHRQGDKFTFDPKSAEIMKNVNTTALQYAPAISVDGLELYFTRASDPSGLRIMVATRASTTEPFGKPCKLKSLNGFVEAPSISLDKTEMFFHKKVDDTFLIFRAVRNTAMANASQLCQAH